MLITNSKTLPKPERRKQIFVITIGKFVTTVGQFVTSEIFLPITYVSFSKLKVLVNIRSVMVKNLY